MDATSGTFADHPGFKGPQLHPLGCGVGLGEFQAAAAPARLAFPQNIIIGIVKFDAQSGLQVFDAGPPAAIRDAVIELAFAADQIGLNAQH